jgi:hypothetical protein
MCEKWLTRLKRLFLVAILFLAGCTSTINVTDKEYVPPFLGKATITKDLFLCFDERNPRFGSRLILNNGFEKCPIHKHIAALPVDTKIEVSKVVKHTNGMLLRLERWFVLGNFGDIEFYYDLGWVQDQDGSFYYTKDEQVPWEILQISNATSGQK